MSAQPVFVVGAGGWGTALAVLLARKGRPVRLWVRNPDYAEELRRSRENSRHLPGVHLPELVDVTTDLQDGARACREVLLAVPSQAVGAVARRLAPCVGPEHTVLNSAKGLEVASLRRLSEVLAAELPHVGAISVVSGPNHAEEVSREIPSATVVASNNPEAALNWQDTLMSPSFRVYTSGDLTGVELGGAMKHIIALAAGISDGLGFGDNTKAAIVTRGLAELIRLGVHLGAQALTFSGLSGLGDLVATCTSGHSRNLWAGQQIGRGKTYKEIMAEFDGVIEGFPTCKAVRQLAHQCQIELPITDAVYRVLFEELPPQDAVKALLSRGRREEMETALS